MGIGGIEKNKARRGIGHAKNGVCDLKKWSEKALQGSWHQCKDLKEDRFESRGILGKSVVGRGQYGWS